MTELQYLKLTDAQRDHMTIVCNTHLRECIHRIRHIGQGNDSTLAEYINEYSKTAHMKKMILRGENITEPQEHNPFE